MAKVLLIHGSCFGAWVWDETLPALRALGHSARAIDLPGRGGTPTTLHAQAKAIADALDGPTILIGHSAGGFPITAAASASPHVTGLIYLAAYIPAPGQSVADLRRAGPSQPMKGAFRITPDRSAYGFAPNRCHDLFFHDCPDAPTHRLCNEPILPQETALHRSPTVPAAAIICTQDRAIPPTYQRLMAKDLPQYDLATGHAPFLANPAALAAALHGILESWT
jgi:pimeloyl-ACP methyl ester carboxylesterase